MAFLQSDYPLHLSTGQKEYNRIFFDALEAAGTPDYAPLFNIGSMGGRLDWSEVHMADVAQIPARSGASAAIDELTIDEIRKKTYTAAEYAAKFKSPTLHWNAMSPDLRAEYPIRFAASARETIRYLTWAVFRNAFSDTGPDGVSLCNDSHTLKNGGNADNKGTSALSASALSAAFAAMGRITTEQGKLNSMITPRYVVVPLELRATAYEIINAQMIGDYSSLVSDANPIRDLSLIPISTNQISESNDWFLVADPMDYPSGLRLLFAQDPRFMSGENTEEVYQYGTTQFALAVGYSTFRPVWGSTGGS